MGTAKKTSQPKIANAKRKDRAVVPQETRNLAISPPSLHKFAYDRRPALPIKPTSTWVAILFHTVQSLSQISDEGDDFMWLKCHGKITIRTLRHHYFTRQPLDEFRLKYINYYPEESDQVSFLRRKSPWADNVIVLRAISEDDVDLVDNDDHEAKIQENVRGRSLYGFDPIGDDAANAIDLDAEDNDSPQRSSDQPITAIVIEDDEGEEDQTSAKDGIKLEHVQNNPSKCSNLPSRDIDQDLQSSDDALTEANEFQKQLHILLERQNLYRYFPKLFRCPVDQCSNMFVVKKWTVCPEGPPICTSCSQKIYEVWKNPDWPHWRPENMTLEQIGCMPDVIEAQVGEEMDLKMSRSAIAFQDYNADAPIDSPQAAVIGRHDWVSSAEGITIEWPDLKSFSPLWPRERQEKHVHPDRHLAQDVEASDLAAKDYADHGELGDVDATRNNLFGQPRESTRGADGRSILDLPASDPEVQYGEWMNKEQPSALPSNASSPPSHSSQLARKQEDIERRNSQHPMIGHLPAAVPLAEPLERHSYHDYNTFEVAPPPNAMQAPPAHRPQPTSFVNPGILAEPYQGPTPMKRPAHKHCPPSRHRYDDPLDYAEARLEYRNSSRKQRSAAAGKGDDDDDGEYVGEHFAYLDEYGQSQEGSRRSKRAAAEIPEGYYGSRAISHDDEEDGDGDEEISSGRGARNEGAGADTSWDGDEPWSGYGHGEGAREDPHDEDFEPAEEDD